MRSLALVLVVSACGVDDRDVIARAGAGGDPSNPEGGSGGAAGASSSAGSAGEGGGSGGSGNAAGSGGLGGAGNGGSGGAPARLCGTEGGACCSDGVPCDTGLGCDGAGTCARCATFRGVGILTDYTSSIAQGISGDGRVVVGYSEDDTGRTMAFRLEWENAGEPVALGVLPGGTSSQARATSYDGYAVVGESGSTNGPRGFRWTAGTLLDLGTWAPGDPQSSAADVSADGNAVALTSTLAEGGTLAYRWLATGDEAPIIGMEEARAISADGNTLVGNRQGASGNEAVIASIADASGVQSLGTLAGDAVAFARNLSADGSLAIGVSGGCGCRGFFWRNGTIDIADGIQRALSTSADGSIIGGTMTATTCSSGSAALWLPGPGTRAVACDVLPAGTVPNGWSLTSVNAISDDGRVIAGEGVNPTLAPEGWVAVIGPDCSAE
jgi:probable HAF family extracellular repeat protein